MGNQGRRMHGRARWGAFLLAGSVLGCESPTPPASLPTLPAPPPPQALDLGDGRMTAECGGVTIRAEPPRRFATDFACEPRFLVDISIEAENGEAMVADFLRRYYVWDWRFSESGHRFRHDLTLLWTPTRQWLTYASDSSLPEQQPLVVRACPEGEGPVIACSESSCEVLPSEDRVQPFVPSWAEVHLEAPWGFSTIQELRAGETLDIPIRYTAHKDALPTSVTMWPGWNNTAHTFGLRLLEPTTQTIPELRRGDSGSLIFRVRAESIPEDYSAFGVYFDANALCAIRPNQVLVRVVPEP